MKEKITTMLACTDDTRRKSPGGSNDVRAGAVAMIQGTTSRTRRAVNKALRSQITSKTSSNALPTFVPFAIVV